MQRTGANRKIIIEILFGLLIALLVVVDQILKQYFSTNYGLGEKSEVIDDFFYLTYTFNTGAAWSFLANVSWGQLFFKILTPIALILFVILYIFAVKNNYRWLKVALVLVIAGTIGNYIDRLTLNGVIDFLSFKFGDYHFPVFNMADVFLVVGIIMVFIHFIFLDKTAVSKGSNANKNDNDKN